jgi:hypothetical protein
MSNEFKEQEIQRGTSKYFLLVRRSRRPISQGDVSKYSRIFPIVRHAIAAAAAAVKHHHERIRSQTLPPKLY